jgi:hypothetical protein
MKLNMEKRAYERIPIHLDVRVFSNGSLHNGLITNLCERGMYIITGAHLSSGLNIELSIPFKEDQLKVPVKIVRTKKTGYIYDGFGAELSNSSQDYLNFIDTLRPKSN